MFQVLLHQWQELREGQSPPGHRLLLPVGFCRGSKQLVCSEMPLGQAWQVNSKQIHHLPR